MDWRTSESNQFGVAGLTSLHRVSADTGFSALVSGNGPNPPPSPVITALPLPSSYNPTLLDSAGHGTAAGYPLAYNDKFVQLSLVGPGNLRMKTASGPQGTYFSAQLISIVNALYPFSLRFKPSDIVGMNVGRLFANVSGVLCYVIVFTKMTQEQWNAIDVFYLANDEGFQFDYKRSTTGAVRFLPATAGDSLKNKLLTPAGFWLEMDWNNIPEFLFTDLKDYVVRFVVSS